MTEELFKRNIDLFLIDFPGCGLSGGEYISLWYHEKNDVGIVIDFIESFPGVGNIGIWGRSMGETTMSVIIITSVGFVLLIICVDSVVLIISVNSIVLIICVGSVIIITSVGSVLLITCDILDLWVVFY